ncbi:MAG: hypothetical protein IPN76_32695 [Saprospiraceae bacterium]|nr:hypothetical protein [Saprospiraceae bacterium]
MRRSRRILTTARQRLLWTFLLATTLSIGVAPSPNTPADIIATFPTNFAPNGSYCGFGFRPCRQCNYSLYIERRC